MNGSIPAILTGGLGNGTFTGSPSLLLTLGFGNGAPPPPNPVPQHTFNLTAYERKTRNLTARA